MLRASRVDVKKLEKQEAKLRVNSFYNLPCTTLIVITIIQAKLEKRANNELYEGSKLLDQHRKQVSTDSSNILCMLSQVS